MRPSGLMLALIALMAFGLGQTGFSSAQAQDTKPPPPAASTPAAPASPPAGMAPASPSSAQTGGLVGEDATMAEQTIVFLSGAASWDGAFGTIVDHLKRVYAYLEKEKITPAGSPMTIYTATDDKGFEFDAAVPVAAAPATPPAGEIKVGKSPSGKALKYMHRGSYDAMDSTYEAITNQLDDKGLEAKDVFVEIYRTDPRSTAEDKLEIEVFVPIK